MRWPWPFGWLNCAQPQPTWLRWSRLETSRLAGQPAWPVAAHKLFRPRFTGKEVEVRHYLLPGLGARDDQQFVAVGNQLACGVGQWKLLGGLARLPVEAHELVREGNPDVFPSQVQVQSRRGRAFQAGHQFRQTWDPFGRR